MQPPLLPPFWSRSNLTDVMENSVSSVDRVRDIRERLIDAGTVVARADGRRRDIFPVAIGAEEGLALLNCVRKERTRRTLESGLGFAVSTLFICEGLLANGPDGHHVAADPFQFVELPIHATTYAGAGLQVLEEAGVRDLIEFYAEESQIVFPRLVAEGREFDLAFIDGNHRFEAVFLDVIYAGRLVKEGGIVFVDDVQLPDQRTPSDSASRTSVGRSRTRGQRGITSGRPSGPAHTTPSCVPTRSSWTSERSRVVTKRHRHPSLVLVDKVPRSQVARNHADENGLRVGPPSGCVSP